MGSFKEGEIGDEVNEKIYVAVSKDYNACKSNLAWAIQKLKAKKICLVHVHQPAQYISILGGYFHVSSVSEQQVMIHQEKERQEMCKILDECIDMYTKFQVEVEKLYTEKENVEIGLVELISEHKIQRLVMGATADNYCTRMKEIKSKKANYVLQHAHPFCHIWFICKGQLIYTREGPNQLQLKVEDEYSLATSETSALLNTKCYEAGNDLSSNFCVALQWEGPKQLQLNVEDEHHLATIESSTSLNTTSSEASFDQSSSNFSNSELSFSQLVEFAPDSIECQLEKENGDSSFRFFDVPLVTEDKDEHPSSPQNVQEQEEINTELYIQLQAILEAENAKQEAFEESKNPDKAEIDAMEAIRKGNSAECLYYKEFSRRKELEEELAKVKEELEITKRERDIALQELKLVASDKLLLVNKFNNIVKEVEKIMSALELRGFKKN